MKGLFSILIVSAVGFSVFGKQQAQAPAPPATPKADAAVEKLRDQADAHLEAKNATALYETLMKLADLEEVKSQGNEDQVEEILHKEKTVLTPEDFVYFMQNELTGWDLEQNQIALTFDDGPHGTLTPQILEVLKSNHVPAAFFEIGNRVKIWPKITKMVADAGFILGNHTWDHTNLTTLDSAQVTSEISTTQSMLSKVLGGAPFFSFFFQNTFAAGWGVPRAVLAPEFFRSPYGARSRRILDIVKAFKVGKIPPTSQGEAALDINLHHVVWLVDSLDWADKDPARIAARVKSQLKLAGDRGIILMHDIHPQTLEAAKILIPALLASGYHFVTLYDVLKAHEATQNLPDPPVLGTLANDP